MSEHDPENLDDLSLTELYQSGDKTQPPAELDQAILALAAKKPSAPVWRRWSGPLASAAVVVLTVGVFLSQSTTPPFSAGEARSASEAESSSKPVSANESRPRRQPASEAQTTREVLPASEVPSAARKSATSTTDAQDQAVPRLRAESVGESEEALFADRQMGAPLAAAVEPAPPPTTIPEDRNQSFNVDAAPMAKMSAIQEAEPAQSLRRDMAIEEVVVTGSMQTAEDKSSPYTATDCAPDANPCEIAIEHPQCAAAYTLSQAVTDLDVRDLWVDVYTSDSTLKLTCEDGDWVVTPVREQD